MDGQDQRRRIFLKGNHAMAAARDHQRLQCHLFHQPLAGAEQFLVVMANLDAQRLFHLRFIGRGRRNPLVVEHAIA